MAKTPTAPASPDLTTAAYLTADEVADLLRIDVRTVRRWAGDGQVNGVLKAGRTWRLPRVEVERFLGRTLASVLGDR